MVILFPVSPLLTLLPSEGQSLSSNQISSTYLNWQLRYNYFRFLKNKRLPYCKSTSGFDINHLAIICTLFCIRLLNFVQIRAPTVERWCHIYFSTRRLRPLYTTSGFSIDGWDITTSVFEKQTSAILEVYFRFRSWPVRRNLHQAIEFRPNQSTHCGNMMSYPFLKMVTAKYYFQFHICWCHCFQKVKVYQQTKFRRDISIGGW